MIEALALEHPVLIVAHGGVFWALQRLLGLGELTHAPNAVVTRFEPPAAPGGAWQITLLGSTPSPSLTITA